MVCMLVKKVMLLLVILDISYLLTDKMGLHQAGGSRYVVLKTEMFLMT
jgi:hypothetical protein